MMPHILEELSGARHFIFLEYFIIEEGKVWDAILRILAEKAACGVDVRVIYDDMGCVGKLPTGYNLRLESMGIKCTVFNPFVPLISAVMNNRDHRKILVIDGHTSFTGGINLSDEYMNITHPFGYWKDTAVMLHGKATWNLTYMFLQMWNVLRGTKEDFEVYRPEKYHVESFEGSGYVQPFSDNPFDDESISQNVYIDIISQAERYVYICTPYLVPDDEMKNAIILAAKRGVDIRLITPGIPDKKTIYRLTRSYYAAFIEAGVSIYEYEPGFLHAKTIVSDDRIAVVGTINMDFRSLYLHFECGVLMTDENTARVIKNDDEQIIQKSRAIKRGFPKRTLAGRIFDSILRSMSPLL
jgi:cardiolipin synthase